MKAAGRFRACGSLTLAPVNAKPHSPGLMAWNWNVARMPEPEAPCPAPSLDRPPH